MASKGKLNGFLPHRGRLVLETTPTGCTYQNLDRKVRVDYLHEGIWGYSLRGQCYSILFLMCTYVVMSLSKLIIHARTPG